MKFQSTLLSDARGKLAGSVFTKNRYASVLRNKVSPVNPNTVRQQAVRASFAAISGAFKALSPDQIAAFNAAVPAWQKTNVFGQSYNPTGQNLYVALNQALAANGIAGTITSASAPGEMPLIGGVPTLLADGTGSSLKLSGMNATFNGVTNAMVPADMTFVIQATPSLSPGKSYLKNRFARVFYVSAGAAYNTDFFNDYVSKFGAPVPSQKMAVRAYFVNNLTGQIGQPIEVSTIIL